MDELKEMLDKHEKILKDNNWIKAIIILSLFGKNMTIEKLIKPITIFQNCQVDKSTIEKINEIGYCMVNNDARVEQISQAFYQMPEN